MSFCWDRESIHGIVHFGKWILLSTAFYFFASQADRLILGKLISFSLLGVYSIAYSVSDIPRAVINAFTKKLAILLSPRWSHLPGWRIPQDVFAVPLSHTAGREQAMLCLMVYLGSFLVARMYDRRYHAASWMVPILALGLWHTLLYATTMPALLSLGKSQYQAIGNAFYCVAMVTAIPLSFHFLGCSAQWLPWPPAICRSISYWSEPAARASQHGGRICRRRESFWFFSAWA
jgi:O-antigen/teichoic acid export membrane protein